MANAPGDIPIQEHLETQMCLWVKAHDEKHVLEARVRDVERDAGALALNLSSSEVARRLEGLNGEADRLRQMQTSYVDAHLYESQREELKRRLDTTATADELRLVRADAAALRKDVEELRLFKANFTGQVVAWSAAVGFVVGVVTFVLNKVL